MKILHVNHLLDPVTGGGTAERTFQLSRFLMSENVECGIITLDIGDISAYEEKLPAETIYKLPCINLRYFVFITWPGKIYRLISRYDAVHLMGHWTMLNALVALLCILQKKPYVICPAGALKAFGRSIWLKRVYDFIVGNTILSRASAWVAITEEERSDFVRYGIAADSVVVIPNGVDPQDYLSYDSATGQTFSRFAPYILFLGRLNEIKGPDLLLKAFADISEDFPEYHLIFAGPDSGLKSSLDADSSRMDLSQRVHFIGHVSGKEKTKILSDAWCLVIPSREEAMSIVVLEAGMCGVPVIFTDRCGLNDFARAGAGLLVSPSAESISQGLREVFSSPEEFRKTGEILQKLVHKNFLWSNQAKLYLSLYRRVTQ